MHPDHNYVPMDADPGAHPLYTPEERCIFGPYDKGDGTLVYADPMRVRRRLKAMLDGNPEKVLAQATQTDVPQFASEATDRVLAAAVYALDLVPFDATTGAGATEDMVVGVLNSFLAFEAEKKTTEPSCPTWPPPTESEPWPGEGDPPSESTTCSG